MLIVRIKPNLKQYIIRLGKKYRLEINRHKQFLDQYIIFNQPCLIKISIYQFMLRKIQPKSVLQGHVFLERGQISHNLTFKSSPQNNKTSS